MVSPVDAFKSRTRKELTLPSGLTVLIRKLQMWDQLGLGELALPTDPVTASTQASEESPEHKRRTARLFSDRMICRGVIDPPFTSDDALRNSPDVVHVGDLDDPDFNALLQEIMVFSGLSVETAASVDAFRDDTERETASSPGHDVPQATERADETVSSGVILRPASELPQVRTATSGTVSFRASSGEG